MLTKVGLKPSENTQTSPSEKRENRALISEALTSLLHPSPPVEHVSPPLATRVSIPSAMSTPLHIALEENQLEALPTLEQFLHSKDENGNTPLHLGAKKEDQRFFLSLVEMGAKMDISNSDGQSPLDLVVLDSGSPPSTDPAGHYFQLFEKAYENGDGLKQLIYLEKLSDFYLSQRDYIKAAHLLNSSISGAIQYGYGPHYRKRLYDKLEQLEKLYLDQELNVQIPNVFHDQIIQYRERMIWIREEAKKQIGHNSIEMIQNELTERLQDVLRRLITECFMLLGDPPTKFAILGLGSMGRHEMCPYSDTEFAIVIDKPDATYKTYFRRLSQLLHVKIVNLGETKFPVIRPRRIGNHLIEAQSLTPSGLCMDIGGLSPLGKEGVYELIGTPQELLVFQERDWLARNEGEIILANAMITCSVLMGDEQLAEAYQKQVKLKLNELKYREERARSILKGHVEEFGPWLKNERIDLRAFDVKKDLYRPFQMILESLALYFGLNSSTTLGRIEELKDKGHFSQEGATNLKNAVEKVLAFRVRTQLFYKEEKEIMLRPKADKDQSFFAITPDMSAQIIEIYRTMVPFHQAAMQFIEKNNKAFSKSSFYEATVGTSNTDKEESLHFFGAEESYIQAVALNPDSPEYLDDLGRIQLKLGQAQESLKHYTRAFTISKKEHGQNHPDVADALTGMARAFADLDENEKSIALYEVALEIYGKALLGNDLPESIENLSKVILGYIYTFHDLGGVYDKTGKKDQAKAMFQLCHDEFRKIYPDQPHIVIVYCLSSLATIYGDSGDTKKALSLVQEALDMQKKLSENKSDPLRASLLNSLAMFYRLLGQPEMAVNAFKNSLETLKALYENRPHPSIAHCLSNLGTMYKLLKDTDQALASFNASLKIHQAVHKNQPHPHIADVLDKLGLTYQELDDITQAIVFFERSLRMLRTYYENKPHPSVASSLTNLADIYDDLGDKAKAKEYYEEALEMHQSISGKEAQQYSAAILGTLGHLYYESKELDKALDYNLRGLEIISAEPNPTAAKIMHNLGMLYNDLKDPLKALQYLLDSLKMKNTIYENGLNLEIAQTLKHLGLTYRKLKEKQKALEAFKQALEMYQALSENKACPHVAFILNKQGNCYRDLNQHQEAVDSYQKSLELYGLLGGTLHVLETAHISRNLAMAYVAQGKHQKALDLAMAFKGVASACKRLGDKQKPVYLYLQSLKVMKAIYGDKPHEDIAYTLYGLGAVYREASEKQKAIESFHSALAMYQEMGEESNQGQISETLNSLGWTYIEAEEYEKAQETAITLREIGSKLKSGNFRVAICYQWSLELLQRLYRDNSQPGLTTANILNHLGKVHEDLGNSEQAVSFYQQSLEMYRVVCAEHSDLPILLTDLGMLVAEEDLQQSAQFLEEALKMYQKLHHNHPHHDTAKTFDKLGLAYANLDEREKAIGFYLEAYDMFIKIYETKSDPDFANNLDNLGRIFAVENNLKKALGFSLRAVEMFRQLGVEKHTLEIAQTLRHIGIIHTQTKNPKGVIEVCPEALTLFKQIYNEEAEEDIATTAFMLAGAYKETGEWQLAANFYDESLNMKRVLYENQPHLDIASTLNRLAEAYEELKNRQQAIVCRHEALDMYDKIYENKPHNNIAIGFYNLGLIYVDAEDKDNARQYIQKSVAMFTLLEGPDGARTKKTEEALSKWNLI